MTQLNQAEIIRTLNRDQFKLPKRVRELLSELDEIFHSTRSQLLGTFIESIDKFESRQIEREVGSNSQRTITRSLRTDKSFNSTVSAIVLVYATRIENKIKSFQRRSYVEGLKGIAKVWNENTPDGLRFTAKATTRELKTITEGIVDGLTIEEWAKHFANELTRDLMRVATMRASRELGGFERGRSLLTKRLRGILTHQSGQVRRVGDAAVNKANQYAFDQEQILFESDRTWDYG